MAENGGDADLAQELLENEPMKKRYSTIQLMVAVLGVVLFSAACESQEDKGSTESAPAEAAPAEGDEAAEEPAAVAAGPTTVSIQVNKSGYQPSSVNAQAGKRLKLIFTRTTDKGCGDKLVFPDHGIDRELPLGEPVEVELTPQEGETISFTCGMGMYEGSIVAKS